MANEEMNWGELGEQWWKETGATVGATEAQVVFSCCFHQGMSATGAARVAKYGSGGSEDGIRQSGHRAAHSVAVMHLLSLAHAETGSGPSGNVELDEAKAILSRLARQTGDPNTRLRAIESLVRISEREQELQRERGGELTDIRAEIAEIAKISPELASAYAESKGIRDWKSGAGNE